jgi:hypothetical protein
MPQSFFLFGYLILTQSIAYWLLSYMPLSDLEVCK